MASSSTLGQAKRSSVRPPCHTPSLTSVRVSNLPIRLQDTLNTHIPQHSGRHFISFSFPWANGPIFISVCPIDHFIELSVIRFNARLRKLYPKLTLSAQRPKTSVHWHVLLLTSCATVRCPIHWQLRLHVLFSRRSCCLRSLFVYQCNQIMFFVANVT